MYVESIVQVVAMISAAGIPLSVTSPITILRLKPLVEVLEQSRGSNTLPGMPKGTQLRLFADARFCPFCAGNTLVLYVACSGLALKFVGVAVQCLLVQQFYYS